MLHLKRSDYSALANHMAGRTRSQLKVLKPCPLCGKLLSPGERVHTVVYSGSAGARTTKIPPAETESAGAGTAQAGSAEPGPAGAPAKSRKDRPRDSLVHMFGCPYCYPPNAQFDRRCPVCGKTIPADGFVVARMFEKHDARGERKHVHVLGCTVCRPGTLR